MERVMKNTDITMGCWLKTYRPTKPVILAAEGFARAGGGFAPTLPLPLFPRYACDRPLRWF